MIHNDVANQLQLLIKAVAPPLIEVADTPLESPQWVPGQRLPAVVLASLPNGRFQVLVSDQELDMNLPRNTQPGEKLDLVFVSAQPRPTFVLARDLPTPQGAPSDAKLSQAARFLGALLQHDVPAAAKGQAGAVTGSAPLLPGAPADVPELARQLGKALAQSGLFYESHQAQWVAGQRTLADLLQEPQGKFSPRLIQPQGQSLAQPQAQASSHAAAGQPPSLPVLQEESRPQATAAQAAVPDRAAAHEPVHPQVAGLVQQQLEVLDGRHVAWQGQVWPGQNMEWQVEEREARRDEHDAEAQREWHTSLRLQMPRLGMVNAALILAAGGVQLKLTAAEPATATAMKNAQDALRQSMDASGLKMLSFAVDGSHG